MNWESLTKEISDLSEKIAYSDVVIGIVRGGMIPARLLSTCLNVKDMYCLTDSKKEKNRTVTSDILEVLTKKTYYWSKTCWKQAKA
jgi:hypoxanthine phosphoribosyltransferase